MGCPVQFLILIFFKFHSSLFKSLNISSCQLIHNYIIYNCIYSKTCLSGHSSITVTRPQRSLFKVPNDFLLICIGHYLSITITCPLRITVTYFGPNHSYSTCGLRAVIAIYCHEAYLARAGRDMASLFTQLA